MGLLVAVAFALDLSGALARSHAEAPERIVIHTIAGGDIAGGIGDLTITRHKHGYSDGKRELDESLARNLVDAALAPPVPTLEIERLHVDRERLRAAAKLKRYLPPATAGRFVERVTDPANLPAIARALYSGTWSDDYPSVKVELTLRGGRKVTLSSTAKQPLMIPWTVTIGGRSVKTWDPDLSRAVAALLPAGFVERSRINGDDLADLLVEYAEMLYRQDTNREGADERVGAQIDPLRRRFLIADAMVGSVFAFNPDGETTWSAKLSTFRTDGVGFSIWLTVRDGKLASPAPFLRDADGLLKRVRDLPWLARYLAANPQTHAMIEYYDDRSLGPHAKKSVLDDLERSGRRDTASQIAPELDRSIAVYVEDGRDFGIWIVLPDGRALLHFGAPLGAVSAIAVGDLMKPDGTLAPR